MPLLMSLSKFILNIGTTLVCIVTLIIADKKADAR